MNRAVCARGARLIGLAPASDEPLETTEYFVHKPKVKLSVMALQCRDLFLQMSESPLPLLVRS
jgi:hypothetical protein